MDGQIAHPYNKHRNRMTVYLPTPKMRQSEGLFQNRTVAIASVKIEGPASLAVVLRIAFFLIED